MKFTLTVDCDNDAFKDHGELARILRNTAERVDGLSTNGEFSGGVHDTNGNFVGRFALAGVVVKTCRHCGRSIVNEDGTWVDLEATGDDSLWRKTCGDNETFTAEHEPDH